MRKIVLGALLLVLAACADTVDNVNRQAMVQAARNAAAFEAVEAGITPAERIRDRMIKSAPPGGEFDSQTFGGDADLGIDVRRGATGGVRLTARNSGKIPR